MILRRDRFAHLVRRQLVLFEEDEAGLLREAEEALERYNAAEREEAEELYGDYVLVLDAIADALDELRDTYAGTLDDGAADAYTASFDRAARKLFPSVPR